MTSLISPLQFINEYDGSNPSLLRGELVIDLPFSHQANAYSVHWGNAQGDKVFDFNGRSEINSFSENSQVSVRRNDSVTSHHFHHPLYHFFEDTQVPRGATHFLLLARYDEQNNEKLISKRVIFSSDSLLPSNATLLEQKLAASAARINQLPLRLGHLWDIDQCPEEYLPWLGWSLSVNSWVNLEENGETQDTYRRRILRKNAWVQKHKGTKEGIIAALDAMGVKVEVKEWWQEYQEWLAANNQEANGESYEAWKKVAKIQPYGFHVIYDENKNSGISSTQLQEILLQTITEIKPVRSAFRIQFEAKTQQGSIQLNTLAHAINSAYFDGELEVGVPIQHLEVDHELELNTQVKMRPIAVVQIAAEIDPSNC